MGRGHSHDDPETASERSLWWALGLTAAFLVVEVIASFVSGSLALLSDAGHMATDVAALGIALLAIRIGRRPADDRRSFGYRRLEILAAVLNAAVLFLIAGYVLWEAINRFLEPAIVDLQAMMVVALVGLVVNAIAMRLLHRGRTDSLNVRGAYLEVWADLLGSIAVLFGALAIKCTGVLWIDPLVAVAIALWVLPRGVALMRQALHVLLEGTPEGIDALAVHQTLRSVDGIRHVCDLHIWSITTGVPLLTAHVEIESMERWDATLDALRQAVRVSHGIEHVTLQPQGRNWPHVRHEHCDGVSDG